MIPFFHAANLVETNLVEGFPWEFCVDDASNLFKKATKVRRRAAMLLATTRWQVYSSVRGFDKQSRVSGENPAHSLHGLVADYDMATDIEGAQKYIAQMPVENRPQFIEVSLGGKLRLVWVFERPVMVTSNKFCTDLLETFFDKLGAPTLLPGFDKSSYKPTEVWTNGGVWYDVNPAPLSWKFCFGVVCEVGKKSALFDQGQIPLETVAEEAQKRFPGRWTGEFKIDSLGVRFWEAAADCPTGCQIKPDGVLCFTGKVPFMSWADIFGRAWHDTQRVLNLGQAGEGIYFDGLVYWELNSARWEDVSRTDIVLRLKGRGLSDRCAKGQTQSDVERVLDHIQRTNRVQGAAPLINSPKGVVQVQNRRVLNIADLDPVRPSPGPASDPMRDWPWICAFLAGLFPSPELLPLDHFLAWLQRSYRVVLNYERLLGQALFLCGPRNNGKTLLCLRIVAPLLGGKVANPIDFITGETTFNSELFSAALLAVNDEDAPGTEASRRRMLARVKGLVVNPSHKFHAKFRVPMTIDWNGRVMVTLNDDPGSVGMLLEVDTNTRDKQMFFASQPYKGVFPPQRELENIVAVELPYFAHWLLSYKPPPQVLTDDRMGVQSYFDPRILELSTQQTFASNLLELVREWERVDAFWNDNSCWTGTPTSLLSALQLCDSTAGIARDWTQQKVAKSLTALAKQEGSRITFAVDGGGRDYQIVSERMPL